MKRCLGDLPAEDTYIGDIVIYNHTRQERVNYLRKIFQRLKVYSGNE